MANPSYYKSILAQVQEATAEALNEDAVLSGRVNFIPENAKDIEYQIKEAMGKQGIVGIIMTPECQYQGTNGKELVWDLRDFTVQIVENPIVNRSNPNPDLTITALDSAIRAADVLGSPSFDLFGIYNPASIEQGEDSGLLVAQARFNCQVRQERIDTTKTTVTYQNGTTREYHIEGELKRFDIADWQHATSITLGDKITSIGNQALFGGDYITEIVVPDSVTSIGDNAFAYCVRLNHLVLGQNVHSLGTRFIQYADLTSLSIPKSVEVIADTYTLSTGSSSFNSLTFEDRTIAEVQAMSGYPWGLWRPMVIHCTDGDITF